MPSPSITMKEISRLGVAQRILLAEKIWESIPDHSDDLELTASQKRELDRRLDSLESGKAKFITWEQIKTDLHKRRLCR
jgi:putative addiction module component (TIGR02574 family)